MRIVGREVGGLGVEALIRGTSVRLRWAYP